MARRPRTREQNQAVYQRRNVLARERGFASYSQQRKEFEYARRSESWQYGQTSYVQLYGIPNARNPADVARVRLFYQAFAVNPNDYSARGAKARWFVEIEQIMDYDEWRERYPTGVR